MKALKKLTGETAIYGVPSIIGRFLNWWLNPLWTYIFLEQANLGVITNIYAYVAFLFVILTYGMETGFFRFSSKEKDATKVFSTSFISLAFSSLLFLIVVLSWTSDIASAIQLDGFETYIKIMGITIAFDVLSTLPFARLRLQHKPLKFAVIKFVNIGINIGFNVFFLVILPYFAEIFPRGIFDKLYDPEFGIGYVFLANMIATLVTFVMLIPHMKLALKFDVLLWKKMLSYSFPILIVGITGMINQNIDKILLPRLLPEEAEPLKQLGIYGASFKMAVVLNMFIQAFRFAFEPFFFSQKNDDNDKTMYVIVMKYFAIFGFMIFLGLSSFIDLFKFIIAPPYREGITIVPIVLMANLFMGIYFTLSLWYKLSDKTRYGAYMGIMGSVITVLINIMLIPYIGYYASAWAILACFVSMVVVSYFLGRKHYPIKYDVKNFLFYLFVSVVLFLLYWNVRTETNPHFWLSILINILFLAIIVIKEKKDFYRLIIKD
ncbi:MAG: polysaccharide biosynthesis C-terminal domain-containing protein [Prolixibacteraceae bacterium]|nr:polysaccharide biosynthesis C-terminal domain-containing protein [Prolixibacteraceae bacterium]